MDDHRGGLFCDMNAMGLVEFSTGDIQTQMAARFESAKIAIGDTAGILHRSDHSDFL